MLVITKARLSNKKKEGFPRTEDRGTMQKNASIYRLSTHPKGLPADHDKSLQTKIDNAQRLRPQQTQSMIITVTLNQPP